MVDNTPVCYLIPETRPLQEVTPFLLALRQIPGEFIFLQDSAPSHSALEAINVVAYVPSGRQINVKIRLFQTFYGRPME